MKETLIDPIWSRQYSATKTCIDDVFTVKTKVETASKPQIHLRITRHTSMFIYQNLFS